MPPRDKAIILKKKVKKDLTKGLKDFIIELFHCTIFVKSGSLGGWIATTPYFFSFMDNGIKTPLLKNRMVQYGSRIFP